MQNYVKDFSQQNKILGQITLGSYLTRDKYILNDQGLFEMKYPLPTMSLAGEKDGLSRVTRFAESFYRMTVKNAEFNRIWEESSKRETNEPSNFNEKDENFFNYFYPVIVFDGVNHMDFAAGNNNFETKRRDLLSQVTLDKAHELIAGSISDFIYVVFNRFVLNKTDIEY